MYNFSIVSFFSCYILYQIAFFFYLVHLRDYFVFRYAWIFTKKSKRTTRFVYIMHMYILLTLKKLSFYWKLKIVFYK